MQTDLLLEVKFSMNLTLKPTKFRTDSNFFQALFYFFFLALHVIFNNPPLFFHLALCFLKTYRLCRLFLNSSFFIMLPSCSLRVIRCNDNLRIILP